jgi:hypothetical protein
MVTPSGWLRGIRFVLDTTPNTLPSWMYDEDPPDVLPEDDAPFTLLTLLRCTAGMSTDQPTNEQVGLYAAIESAVAGCFAGQAASLHRERIEEIAGAVWVAVLGHYRLPGITEDAEPEADAPAQAAASGQRPAACG